MQRTPLATGRPWWSPPPGDGDGEAAARACTAGGWMVERCGGVPPALLRLVRPASGQAAIGLLLASATVGGLGGIGLAKAARARSGSLEPPLIVVGAAALDLPRSRAVASGDADGLAAAIAAFSATEPALVDAATVAGLRTLPGLWERALASFAADLPRSLAELEAAADLTQLHRCAHALKGVAGSMGAMALHGAIADLDRAAVAGDAGAVAARLPAIRGLAVRSLAALQGS